MNALLYNAILAEFVAYFNGKRLGIPLQNIHYSISSFYIGKNVV